MDTSRHRPVSRSLVKIAAITAVATIFYRQLVKRARAISFRDRVVIITGGSRGLGLLLAKGFAAEGAHIVICARDQDELSRARADIVAQTGARVLAIPCNIASENQVQNLIETALARFGRIDVLVNNAGIMMVGPFENFSRDDFAKVMDVNFWGSLHASLHALPHLPRGGRIVNITSIGAMVAVPHLLPYTVAKFAAEGFSEGLHAEATRRGVRVVTVDPGLMRTGSYFHALFKGSPHAEFRWFSAIASLPIISINAERAAERIITACRYGESLVTLGLPAKFLRLFHGIFPGFTTDVLAVGNRLLPSPQTQSVADYRHRA